MQWTRVCMYIACYDKLTTAANPFCVRRNYSKSSSIRALILLLYSYRIETTKIIWKTCDDGERSEKESVTAEMTTILIATTTTAAYMRTLSFINIYIIDSWSERKFLVCQTSYDCVRSVYASIAVYRLTFSETFFSFHRMCTASFSGTLRLYLCESKQTVQRKRE